MYWFLFVCFVVMALNEDFHMWLTNCKWLLCVHLKPPFFYLDLESDEIKIGSKRMCMTMIYQSLLLKRIKDVVCLLPFVKLRYNCTFVPLNCYTYHLSLSRQVFILFKVVYNRQKLKRNFNFIFSISFLWSYHEQQLNLVR